MQRPATYYFRVHACMCVPTSYIYLRTYVCVDAYVRVRMHIGMNNIHPAAGCVAGFLRSGGLESPKLH